MASVAVNLENRKNRYSEEKVKKIFSFCYSIMLFQKTTIFWKVVVV